MKKLFIITISIILILFITLFIEAKIRGEKIIDIRNLIPTEIRPRLNTKLRPINYEDLCHSITTKSKCLEYSCLWIDRDINIDCTSSECKENQDNLLNEKRVCLPIK